MTHPHLPLVWLILQATLLLPLLALQEQLHLQVLPLGMDAVVWLVVSLEVVQVTLLPLIHQLLSQEVPGEEQVPGSVAVLREAVPQALLLTLVFV